MYTSSTNRVTGLSGIDTETMITKLMTAESQKLYRYQKSVTWKTWQQESYRSVISKLNSFQDKWVGTSSTSLRFSSAFQSYKNSVTSSKTKSESSAITINSSSSSQNYKISVNKLAKSDTYVGANTVSKNIEGTVDVDRLSNKISSGETIEMKVTLDGTVKTIALSADDFIGDIDSTSVQDVLNQKLSKVFGKENGTEKVSVSIGSDGTFSFNTLLGHSASIANSGSSTDSYMISGGDADKDAKGSFDITIDGKKYSVTVDENTKGSTLAAKITKALGTAKMYDDSGNLSNSTSDISAFVKATIADDKLKIANTSSTKSIEISNSSLDGVSDAELSSTSDLNNLFGVASGSSTTIKSSNTLEEFFSDDIWDADGKATLTINDETISFSKDDTLAKFMSAVNDSKAGVTVNYNSTNAKFNFSSSETGAVNTITFGKDANTEAVLTNMGFDVADLSSQQTSVAQDAEIVIDGVTTTRSSNTFDLEGMNVTINDVTEDGETLTLGNTYDVDAVYETISSFVEEYNTLIEELNGKVSESRAKSDDYSYYEPLTDTEKKDMSEDEIKLWEEKAKTGLLYKDDTLQSVLSKMRSVMYSSIQLEDGSKVGLYELGITTSSNYSENGKLVIDEEKLKTAIQERGDDIQAIFTGNSYSKGIGDQLNEVVKSATGIDGSLRAKAGVEGTSSVTTNTLTKQIKELNERISAEKERLITKETNYYKMFSSMESAITASDNQLNSLLSMLGS